MKIVVNRTNVIALKMELNATKIVVAATMTLAKIPKDTILMKTEFINGEEKDLLSSTLLLPRNRHLAENPRHHRHQRACNTLCKYCIKAN
jgi:hypothetical protein